MSDETTIHPAITDEGSRAYLKPTIVHELKLETRAGSPLGGDPLIDPLGVDPTIH